MDEYDMRTGDFWDNGRIQEQFRTSGEWSTGLCDFVPWDFVLASMCPCLLVYHMLKVTGPVRVIGTGALQLDRIRYALVFVGLSLMLLVMPPVRSCHSDDQPEHQHHTDVITPDGGRESHGHKRQFDCTNYTNIGFEVLFWLLVFVAVRGIIEKMNIKEEWGISLLKSACILEYCFFCQVCYLAQVARHVYTSQGFVRTHMVRQTGRQGPTGDHFNRQGPAEDVAAATPLTAMPQTAAPSASPLSNVIEEAAE